MCDVPHRTRSLRTRLVLMLPSFAATHHSRMRRSRTLPIPQWRQLHCAALPCTLERVLASQHHAP
jgi:hypothetical protein